MKSHHIAIPIAIVAAYHVVNICIATHIVNHLVLFQMKVVNVKPAAQPE